VEERSGLGRLRRSGTNRPLVSFQRSKPVRQIPRIVGAWLDGNSTLRAKECGTKLGLPFVSRATHHSQTRSPLKTKQDFGVEAWGLAGASRGSLDVSFFCEAIELSRGAGVVGAG
jgi:hypothetical protein